MSALNSKHASIVNYSIKKLAERFLPEIHLTISGKEFVDTFIEPEHLPVLRQCEELCGSIGETTGMTFLVKNKEFDMGLRLSFVGKAPIIIPQYAPVNGPTKHAPKEVFNKISNWAEERYKYGSMFADALGGFDYLNKMWELDAKTMAVLFPVMPVLLKMGIAEGFSEPYPTAIKLADRIHDSRGVGKFPKLEREFTHRMQEVSRFIQSLTFLEPAATIRDRQMGTVEFSFTRIIGRERIGYIPGLPASRAFYFI